MNGAETAFSWFAAGVLTGLLICLLCLVYTIKKEQKGQKELRQVKKLTTRDCTDYYVLRTSDYGARLTLTPPSMLEEPEASSTFIAWDEVMELLDPESRAWAAKQIEEHRARASLDRPVE